jgi:serine/threonine protein kinase
VELCAVTGAPAKVEEPSLLGCDFELLSVLGEGGGGRVYLARERALDRLVALKVVPDAGIEANTLAQLEHDHIVRVFFQRTVKEPRQRLICMQYVPGTTLERVVKQLRRASEEPTGEALLATIGALSGEGGPLDVTVLSEREALGRADALAATCLIGAALARALAHAHQRGVIHRDVKPGNILLTPFGRPMLVDFDIAASASCRSRSRLGITHRYAAPEQLMAFDDRVPWESIDARADLYSLGVVLFELLAGHLPFDNLDPKTPVAAHLDARQRASYRLDRAERSARVLERVLRRCLAYEPGQRYATAEELASALEACAALRTYEHELPETGRITRWAGRHPIAALSVAGLVPHALGSAIAAGYALSLPLSLTPPQVTALLKADALYIGVGYPLGLWAIGTLVSRLGCGLKSVDAGEAKEVDATSTRRKLLALPVWGVVSSYLAWILAVPFCRWYTAIGPTPLPRTAMTHFALCVLIAGTSAAVYMAINFLYVSLRVILPWATVDGRDLATPLGVGVLPARLRALQLVASGGPPLAAVLLLTLPKEPLDTVMRGLLVCLMVLCVLGFTVATHFAGEATRSAEAFERLRARIAKARPMATVSGG